MCAAQTMCVRTGGGEATGDEGDAGGGGQREGVDVFGDVRGCVCARGEGRENQKHCWWALYLVMVGGGLLCYAPALKLVQSTIHQGFFTDGADVLSRKEPGQIGHVRAGALALLRIGEAEGQRGLDCGQGGEEPEGEGACRKERKGENRLRMYK